MPILFGTLAALAMVIAAWTTLKNQDEYKNQIKLRGSEEKELAKNLKKEEDRKEELEQEKAATEEFVSAIAGLEEDLQKQKEVEEGVAKEISEKKQQKIELQAEVDEANEVLAKTGDVENLVSKIQGIQMDIAELKDDIEKEEANLASLKQVKKVTQSQIDIKVGEAERIAQGKSQEKLSTTIKTVYSNWGFVTLNGGDTQGVVPDSVLDVMRDGEVVAKLKVTTVEPNRAAADIVRDSLKDEYYLRSGDKVVAEAEAAVVASDITVAPVVVKPEVSEPAPAPAAPAIEDNPFE